MYDQNSIVFDILFDYARVQQFIRSFENRFAGAISNDIIYEIKRINKIEPELEFQDANWILRKLKKTKWQNYEIVDEEALHAIEYYMIWEKLSPNEKDAIRKERLVSSF